MDAKAAYDRIAALEPSEQYLWSQVYIQGTSTNILYGRSPTLGSEILEGNVWDCWDDPVFTVALQVVDRTLTLASASHKTDHLRSFFELQMSYLLLWSAIERYVSLRYSLSTDVCRKLRKLGTENAFSVALETHVTEKRYLRSASDLKKKTLDPLQPQKAIDYYYQVRCNVTHRGKGNGYDYEIVKKSSLRRL